jgi:hypothetical protein
MDKLAMQLFFVGELNFSVLERFLYTADVLLILWAKIGLWQTSIAIAGLLGFAIPFHHDVVNVRLQSCANVLTLPCFELEYVQDARYPHFKENRLQDQTDLLQ